jgi:glutathione S-transferase
MGLHLVIGNKNYSSWSFRPWLAMKVAGIAFEETLISFDAPDFKSRVTALSGAGKVPVLIDGEARIWESLAILEYLAEKFPASSLWPRDMASRAHARAIASEMHAGFLPLRRQLPMNVRRPVKSRALEPDAGGDVARIDAIWSECRIRFGTGGPFLYGAFSAADAMYAPVVWRFHTYAVEVSAAARDYMRALMALPPWLEWREAARHEPWIVPHDEVDWPEVPREEA